MCVDSCVERSEFCFRAYIDECSNLAVDWYVWQPPGETFPRVDRILNELKRKDEKRRAILFAWANRTDPGAKVRTAAARKMWEERAPGVTVVVPDKKYHRDCNL